MTKSEQIIKGLQILAVYGGEVSAQHEVIYAGPSDMDEISPEHRQELEALGWHFDGDVDSWAVFT